MILVGSGGFAEEVCFWLGKEIENVTGYLGPTPGNLPAPYLGSIENYNFKNDDRFLLAIGLHEYRYLAVQQIKARKGQFVSFFHPTALIAKDVIFGEGCLAGPYTLVSSNGKIGHFCLLNNYSSVGHHTVIGDFSILGPYASVTGNCILESNVQMGTHSSMVPKTTIASGTKVSPGSSVYRKTSPGDVIMGVPGKAFKGL